MSDYINDVLTEADEAEDTAADTTADEDAQGEGSAQTAEGSTQPEAKDDKAEEQQPAEDTTQAEEAVPGLMITFNRETKELSHEDAVKYAQLGMFLEQAGGEDNIRWLKQSAKAAGYDNINEYREAVQRELDKADAARIASEKEIPLDVAKELLEKNRQLAQYQQEQEASKAAADEKQKIAEEAVEFGRMFPDVDIRNLPDEVLRAKLRNPDVPVYYHYAFWKMNQLNTQIAVQAKQADNEATAQSKLGSADSGEGSEEDNILNSIFK